VTEPGDVILVPDPGFAAYIGGTALSSARIHRVPLLAENDFLVPPEEILRAPSPLRLVYLNYPNNPTAACADRAYLEEVAAACRERGAVLANDNAYAEIAFDGYRPPSLLQVDGVMDVGIEFHSFSKSFNMTGWRLGWACGSRRIIGALKQLKLFVDTGAYLPIQAAGAAAIRGAEGYLAGNVARLQDRRDAAVRAFRAIGFEVAVPQATLYLWMPVPGERPAAQFASDLLEATGVVLLPGSSLGRGGEGYVRAALTIEPDRYAVAADRIAGAR
jgi:LL-diaminopimelate aminotransferase